MHRKAAPMLGAVFLGNRKVEIRKFPDPKPGPGEVVIEMKASGMCGSDLKFYRSAPGEAQKALGLGADASRSSRPRALRRRRRARPRRLGARGPIGQRVMDHHYSGCGVCKHCRVGWSQLCQGRDHGLRRHGAWRSCAIHEGAGAHAGAAAGGASLRRGCRGLVRHGHRLRRAASRMQLPAARSSRCSGRVRSAERHAARRRDGRARHRGGDECRATAGEGVRRQRWPSIPRRTS